MGSRPLALAATAIGLAATAALASASVGLTVKSSKSSALKATIVVNATGRTLYHTNVEHKNVVKCTGACAETWPPLLAAGAKPVAGPGVTASKLGIVKRPDGKMQVTYNGYALYLYAGDSKAGQVNGQGTAGVWHAVSTTGAVVTTQAATGAASSSSSSSSGGGYSSGGTTSTTPAFDPGSYG
jgi:predicted lipoprotein with Yx(FWY)xxD motif